MQAFGHLPARGETIEIEGYLFKVAMADSRRIIRVHVKFRTILHHRNWKIKSNMAKASLLERQWVRACWRCCQVSAGRWRFALRLLARGHRLPVRPAGRYPQSHHQTVCPARLCLGLRAVRQRHQLGVCQHRRFRRHAFAVNVFRWCCSPLTCRCIPGCSPGC